jgi:hypothetical protein
MGDLVSKLLRSIAAVAISLLLTSSAFAHKTRNIVLITTDGLRWREVFTGADKSVIDDPKQGSWLSGEDMRKQFWRDDVDERRKVLFPFLWGTVAKQGQLFGNQNK